MSDGNEQVENSNHLNNNNTHHSNNTHTTFESVSITLPILNLKIYIRLRRIIYLFIIIFTFTLLNDLKKRSAGNNTNQIDQLEPNNIDVFSIINNSKILKFQTRVEICR